MNYCPSCGSDTEVTVSEGDKVTWVTRRCKRGCGFVSTFADYGVLDLGLPARDLEPWPFPTPALFTETFEKLCVPIDCGEQS